MDAASGPNEHAPAQQHGPHPGLEQDDRSVPASYDDESYNPWTIVNLVFTHLADQGLHPVLGEHGDPGEHARALLVAMGIRPMFEGNREVVKRTYEHLAEIRSVMFDDE